MKPIKWAYGVTTVIQRFDTLLPKTMASLKEAGFPTPHLFVDGAMLGQHQMWENRWPGCIATVRVPPSLGVVGNFILGLYEMVIREPETDYYLMVQDDVVLYKNLRPYLEQLRYPHKGFVSLYSFPDNEALVPLVNGKPTIGYHPGNQRGRGAVALLFSREAAMLFLASGNTVRKPVAANNPRENLDGCIVTSFNIEKWSEYVHWPSLVGHTGGAESVMGHTDQSWKVSQSFRGESFDALSLLPEVPKEQRARQAVVLG